MKVKVLEKGKEKLTFLLEGTTPAFANALRRTMISGVPVLAIKWVDIHENSSVIFDEMLANRLGLVPLSFKPDKLSLPGECKCGGKGCPLCQVMFALEKDGPGTAYSGDMKSSNKEVKPTSPTFPLADLLKNHSVKLEATAQLGTGKEHAKFQAANASYQYFPVLAVHDLAKAKAAAKECPAGALDVKQSKITIKDPVKCNLCKSCQEASEGALEVKGDPTRFIFFVESVSGLPPQDIVAKAAEVVGEKAEEFRKELAKA